MNPAELGDALALVGVWVQLGGTVLPLTLFYLLARHAGARPYFVRWSWAWLAMVAAIAAVVLRYWVAPTVELHGLPLALVASLHGLYLFAKICFFGLLGVGTWEFTRGPVPGGRLAFILVVTGAVAVAGAWHTQSLDPIMPVQAAIAVPALLLSAVLLQRLPAERRTLGTRFTAGVLVLMAVLWTVYGAIFLRLDPYQLLSPIKAFLSRYTSFIDTACGMLVAFGMVVILLEDARREADRARAEHLRVVAQSQAHLAQSLRMEALGRLVSGVAHELNNPLGTILTFSEQLLQEPHAADAAAPLATIRDQARRARAVVRDLLTFVRRRETSREPADIALLVERTTRALAADFDRQGVALEVTVAPDLPPFLCDPPAIEQVLTNLLDNAARAAASGAVTLDVRREGDLLLIRVEDEGPGIPPQHLVSIFEPFFTTRGTGEGTGLGLSVSLGIAEQHGGWLRAENREPGPGARFIAGFPLNQPVHAVTPTRGTAALTRAELLQAGQGSVAGRALIIDDEAPFRASIRRYLERIGWRVTEAANGAEGLRLLLGDPAPPYDLILCDLKMPGVSGQELYQRLEAARPALVSRLVFASGDTASRETAAFLANTSCMVLEKPFELAELATVLGRMVPQGSPA